jgi:aminoglycoside 3'-phosphotransferase-2
MSTSFGVTTALPTRLSWLGARTPITVGMSDAVVWRVECGEETLFLKAEATHPLGELPGEVERLRWLSSTPVPAPRVHEAFAADGATWLLMTALPGADLTHLVDRPADLCDALATGLRALHGLDPSACPFDQRLDARLADGAARVAAGLVDETDFDTAWEGRTAAAVLAWLRQNRPASEDLVVAHGDASLPNIMADEAGFSGILDCGRLGVADRWQDLALACRSIIFNCGEAHVPSFLATYGAAWDEERYRYYCAVDELF